MRGAAEGPPPRCLPPPSSRYLQHVGHVEEGAVAAGVQVGLEVPAAVLHGQAPAGERHHPAAPGPVQGVQRRPFQPPRLGPARLGPDPGPAQRRRARAAPAERGADPDPQHPPVPLRPDPPRLGPARLCPPRRGSWDMRPAPSTAPRPRDEAQRQRHSSVYPGLFPPPPLRPRSEGRGRRGAKPPGGALGHGRVHAGSRRGSGVGEEVDIVAAVHLRGESCRGCPRSPPLRAGRWGHSRRSGRCGRPPGEPGSPPSAPTFAAPPSTPSPGRGAPVEKQERCCGAPSPGTGLPRRGEGAPA